MGSPETRGGKNTGKKLGEAPEFVPGREEWCPDESIVSVNPPMKALSAKG